MNKTDEGPGSVEKLFIGYKDGDVWKVKSYLNEPICTIDPSHDDKMAMVLAQNIARMMIMERIGQFVVEKQIEEHQPVLPKNTIERSISQMMSPRQKLNKNRHIN